MRRARVGRGPGRLGVVRPPPLAALSEHIEPEEDGRTVDLMEYQGKELFAKHGVPAVVGNVVEKAEDAASASEQNGGRVVVKAQVKVGSPGQGCGPKLAENPDEAADRAPCFLGMGI